MTTLLTTHITLEEMTESQTATRNGLSNVPDRSTYYNLVKTAEMLEAVRSLLGNRPILISSGYRSPAVNAAVGGARSSAHTFGKAADFICPGYGRPIDVCRAIQNSGLMFDQLIHEFNSWCHLAWDENMRQQTLTINNNGTVYGL